jgi:hypothetical protein
MTDMPRFVAGDPVPEELTRITEAYLREHDMPAAGQRLNADLCNAAIDWWSAIEPEGSAS